MMSGFQSPSRAYCAEWRSQALKSVPAQGAWRARMSQCPGLSQSIAVSGAEPLVRGLDAETLSFWTFNGSGTFARFCQNLEKQKTTDICVVPFEIRHSTGPSWVTPEAIALTYTCTHAQ